MKAACALAVLSLLVFPGCRRPDPGTGPRLEAELAGGWLREQRGAPGRVEGFDLRPDGSVTLIGILSMNAVAWTVSRNELVISTNTDRYPKPNPSRFEIASLEHDVLVIRADPPDPLAGTWRRSEVRRVSGAVTYLESVPLPDDARVEVRIVRAGQLLARTLSSPKDPVPIPFSISYPPAPAGGASDDSIEARIIAADGPLFATARPISVPSNTDTLEVIVLSRNR